MTGAGSGPDWANLSRGLAGSRGPLSLWSNAVVFVRVWEYEVPGDRAAAFTTAYAADGAWGQSLDARLEGLAVAERSLFEGSS